MNAAQIRAVERILERLKVSPKDIQHVAVEIITVVEKNRSCEA